MFYHQISHLLKLLFTLTIGVLDGDIVLVAKKFVQEVDTAVEVGSTHLANSLRIEQTQALHLNVIIAVT